MGSPAALQSLLLHAAEARLGRLSSSAATLDIKHHVSSGLDQHPQRRSPQLGQQHQQPSPALSPLQARLCRLLGPRRVTVGCQAHFVKALLPELRSGLCRRRSRPVPRRPASHHGARLPPGESPFLLSFLLARLINPPSARTSTSTWHHGTISTPVA